MLDASGVQEPGFIWGHNHWIGSEKGCEAAREPLSITVSDRYRRVMKPNLVAAMAPFDVGYRMVYARHQSAWQIEMKFQSEVSELFPFSILFSTRSLEDILS